MNKPNRDAGGAMVAAAIVFMILIVLVLGGGFFFFASLQRSARQEVMQQALLAERRAMVMAEEQRSIAQRQLAVSSEALSESQVLAKTDLAWKKDEDATTSGVSAPADGQTTAIDRLGWLVNHWQHIDGEKSSEEHWIAPRGGIMLGVNRSVDGKGKMSFEYLRIESAEDDRMVHYASPMGRGETAFSLLEVAQGRVVFENPEHDFPRRISYWLDDQGRLHARIEGEIDGKSRESE